MTQSLLDDSNQVRIGGRPVQTSSPASLTMGGWRRWAGYRSRLLSQKAPSVIGSIASIGGKIRPQITSTIGGERNFSRDMSFHMYSLDREEDSGFADGCHVGD